MPICKVIVYQTERGRAPVRNWLRRQNLEVRAKAIELAKLLRANGEDLIDTPHAKFLRDGIYELRIIVQRVQHRILYAFVGRRVVLLTNGVTKEGKVPPEAIEKALRFKEQYLKNPEIHTHEIYE